MSPSSYTGVEALKTSDFVVKQAALVTRAAIMGSLLPLLIAAEK
jgi:hypothetical protein